MKRSRKGRMITHMVLWSMTILLYVLVALLIPREKQGQLMSIMFGYFSLLLIGVTLLIGPLNLLRMRHNPVHLDLRRDVGIWAAITGCWHVVLVIQGRVFDGSVLLYFLRAGCCGYVPQFTLFGISNDLGLLATVLLLVLLALSNTFSLRVLKGKRWKQVQRLTYLLMLFAAAHTLGYEYLNLREPLFFVFVIALLVLVLVGQGIGIALTLSRQR